MTDIHFILLKNVNSNVVLWFFKYAYNTQIHQSRNPDYNKPN